MSGPRPGEVKWDVASPELLRTLITSQLPLGLRKAEPVRSFYRDIYYDTADGALARRNMTARFRIGANDRRSLKVRIDAPRESFVSVVPELELRAALTGTSEAA
jgi:hypothetical protein